jgi:molecular chaperone GrpE
MSSRFDEFDESLDGDAVEGPEALGGPAEGHPASPTGSGRAVGDRGTPEEHAGPGSGEAAVEGETAADPFELGGLEQLLSNDFARISAERDEYLDSLKRLQADFDNFRKRVDRQQSELRTRASEALLVRLLPVLDSLDLALAHLGVADGEAPADEAARSLVQINAQLRDILQREGLERIDEAGVQFDPTIHEATAVVEEAGPAGAPAQEGGTVSEVWRSGYRLGDRVIRPAMVRVRG